MDDIKKRLALGREKYGHGVRVHMDTTTWGTPKNSWMEMAREEFLDAVVYVCADYIVDGRKNEVGMSDGEAYYRHNANDKITEDDNDLILYIIEHVHDLEVGKHKTLLVNLLNILHSH